MARLGASTRFTEVIHAAGDAMHSMYRRLSRSPTPPSPPHRGVSVSTEGGEVNSVGFSVEQAYVRQFLPSALAVEKGGLIAQIHMAAGAGGGVAEEVVASSPHPSTTIQPSQDPLSISSNDATLSTVTTPRTDNTHSTFLYDLSRFVVRLVEDPPTSGGAACAIDRWLMPYGIFSCPDGDEEEEEGVNPVEGKTCASKDELARDAFLTQVDIFIHTCTPTLRKYIPYIS